MLGAWLRLQLSSPRSLSHQLLVSTGAGDASDYLGLAAHTHSFLKSHEVERLSVAIWPRQLLSHAELDR